MKSIVLHVEDDPNDALLMNLAFRKLDLDSQLQTVDDGDKAIAYLTGQAPFNQNQEPSLPSFVFLDLKLHRCSGFEVLKWIRGQPGLRALPVVILSSSVQPEDVRRAYELGANSYVSKPSSLEGIVEMVRVAHAYWTRLNQVGG